MTTSSPSPSSSSSIVIVIIIVASAIIVSAPIYLLLRLISKRFHRSFHTFAAADDVVLRHHSNPNLNQCHVVSSNLLDSLPLFTFGSITGNLTGDDSARAVAKPLITFFDSPIWIHQPCETETGDGEAEMNSIRSYFSMPPSTWTEACRVDGGIIISLWGVFHRGSLSWV
ncbi:unnamed protein product [Fraxinus pennsylvanica]|uniref:Uncharacterized protein n=1 Tax=Fraxinus pennsylvanica TaxID=56036 RepID=A0AAD2DSS8_9LAMI|nr:unnamed protein product [Fraxinus pennsylvanica]